MTDLFQEINEDTLDPSKNYLEELVGDGKKFKTPEELAKGKFYADTQINILTKKLDEMRADYMALREDNAAKDKLDDLLKKIENERNNMSDKLPDTDEDKSGLKIEDVKSLFQQEYSTAKTREKEDANFNYIQSKLKEVHGKNAQEFLSEQMQNLGLNKETINDMARKQPKFLERALGLDQPKRNENFQAPPFSSLRNEFSPSGGPKRTWSYYQELRKTKPDLYHDPKTNIQMQKDAIELGEAFMDGDFNI